MMRDELLEKEMNRHVGDEDIPSQQANVPSPGEKQKINYASYFNGVKTTLPLIRCAVASDEDDPHETLKYLVKKTRELIAEFAPNEDITEENIHAIKSIRSVIIQSITQTYPLYQEIDALMIKKAIQELGTDMLLHAEDGVKIQAINPDMHLKLLYYIRMGVVVSTMDEEALTSIKPALENGYVVLLEFCLNLESMDRQIQEQDTQRYIFLEVLSIVIERLRHVVRSRRLDEKLLNESIEMTLAYLKPLLIIGYQA